jgi:hypothetical protein
MRLVAVLFHVFSDFLGRTGAIHLCRWIPSRTVSTASLSFPRKRESILSCRLHDHRIRIICTPTYKHEVPPQSAGAIHVCRWILSPYPWPRFLPNHLYCLFVIPAKAGIQFVNEFNSVSKPNALTHKFKCYDVLAERLCLDMACPFSAAGPTSFLKYLA